MMDFLEEIRWKVKEFTIPIAQTLIYMLTLKEMSA